MDDLEDLRVMAGPLQSTFDKGRSLYYLDCFLYCISDFCIRTEVGEDWIGVKTCRFIRTVFVFENPYFEGAQSAQKSPRKAP